MSRHQFVCIHEGVYANPLVGEERSSAVWNNIVTFVQPRELREWISPAVYFIDLTPDIFISFPPFPIPPRRISSSCRSIIPIFLGPAISMKFWETNGGGGNIGLEESTASR
jgi:hypothetical protein